MRTAVHLVGTRKTYASWRNLPRVTDHPPSEPRLRVRVPEGLEVGSFRPEAVGLPPEPSQYVNRSHDLLLMTKMVSVGVDRSRLGLLQGAAARLRDLSHLPWTIKEASGPSPLAGGDISLFLLRTSEEASGIPCGTSGLFHGLAPAPASTSLALDGQHRLSEVQSVLRVPTGIGKTAHFLSRLVDKLAQRLGSLSRDGCIPTLSEFARIADDAKTLAVLLQDLTQRLLTGCIKSFGHLVSVPPNETSPCGVLRLAVPRVPRAPGVGPVPDPTEFALAT